MMAINARLRFRILARDGHACVYCGARPPDVRLVIDHVIPRMFGGTDHPSNLAAACDLCNAGKGGFPADAPPEHARPKVGNSSRRSGWAPAGSIPSPTTRVRAPRKANRIHICHYVSDRSIYTPCGFSALWQRQKLIWLPGETEPTCGMCVLVPPELRSRPPIGLE
jgi:hypothetical protein